MSAPDAPYTLVLALLTLFYLSLDHLGRADWPLVCRHERAFAPLSGFTSGIFEGTANVAAPPLIIFYLALGLTPVIYALHALVLRVIKVEELGVEPGRG